MKRSIPTRVSVSLQAFVLAFIVAASADAAPLIPFATLTVNGTVYDIPLMVSNSPLSDKYSGVLALDLATGPILAYARMSDGLSQENSWGISLTIEATNESDLPLNLSLSA